jgi:hypothetical protein
MKKNILILIAGLMLLGTSCSKDFLSVNEVNPNTPSKVEAKLVLPAALNAIAFNMNYPRRFEFAYLWHGLWSVSAGYSQPQFLVQYKLRNSDYQQAFLDFYTTANNLNAIEKGSTEVYYVAIAKIMKAYIFQNLVDCWGDVPYSEAFQAEAGNLKPVYDKQKDIYEDLVVQLDAAMASIQGAPVTATAVDPNSDIIYGGDMSKWLKFANTLKLRILIHQAGMDGRASYITDAIATTSSIGYIGAGEGALNNPGYTASFNTVTDNKENPCYGLFYNASANANTDGISYYFAGRDAVDYYLATSDPRLAKFFQTCKTSDGSDYNGNYFGYLPADLTSQDSTSKLGYVAGDEGTMIGTPTKSAPILTDFESLFIQAEAAQRGLIAGDAKSLYESALTQSFEYMGLGINAPSFISQPNPKVNYDNAQDKLELILTQKWASLNGIAPVEIWTDYRRTGYPSNLHFSVDPALAGPGTPPVRLLYPQDEINVNNANVLAAKASQNWVSEFDTKIFWQNR